MALDYNGLNLSIEAILPELIVAVFALLGRPSVALASVAITSGASLAIRLYLTRRVVRAQIGRR